MVVFEGSTGPHEATEMVRAGVYVRISRDREGTEVSVERQKRDCTRLAEDRGWQVTKVYSDNDVSASDHRKVRRGYRMMLADLESGSMDAIIGYSSSRFYRRVRELDELIDLLEQRQVEVATVVSGQIDLTTADGRMTARLLAVIDQGEAERIGERSSRAKADIKKNGGWLGGGAPAFGYERIKDSRGKVKEHRIVESEAMTLREVRNRALAGESLNRIAADLNERGIRPRKADHWTPSRLRVILTSPFHAGRHSDGTRGSWPAIFTDDEATLLRSRFPQAGKGKGRGKGERPARAYPLAGLVVCSVCGQKLLGSAGSYRCQARNGGCGKSRAPSWAVDQFVDAALHRRWVVREELPPESPDTAPLLAEVHAGEARLTELREAYADGEITLDDYKAMSDGVRQRIEAAETSLRSLPQKTPPMTIPEMMEEAEELYERWARRELTAAELAELNEMFRAVIERVVVQAATRRGRPKKDAPAIDSSRVEIKWRS